MILVFGGTTEGKQVAAILEAMDLPYYYSTKTKVVFTGKGKAIFGAMTTEMLDAFCKKHKIELIINASHPFAEVLHATVASVKTPIPLLRVEREFTPRVIHPLVTYCTSFKEAISIFKNKKYTSLLALSGVQTIVKLQEYWRSYKTWFRILDRDSSREIAQKAEFSKEALLYGYPQTTAGEVALINNINPQVILTKESGVNGKTNQKIQAAIATKTPIVIIQKPLLSNRYICIKATNNLSVALKQYIERITRNTKQTFT